MVDRGLFEQDVLQLTPIEVIQKYITFGTPHVFPDEGQYYSLKKRIADKFNVHPTSVLVVGSGKLGFSIAPHKYGKLFGDESDIDIAIVSDHLFDQYWKLLYKWNQAGGEWDFQQKRKFQEYLFSGWIRPDKFPKSTMMAEARDWWDFFRGVTLSREFGPYKVAAGLYRDVNFLENYQLASIDSRRRLLEVHHDAGKQERTAQ